MGRILSSSKMKAVTTTNSYIQYYKTNPVGFDVYAKTSKVSYLSYIFAVYAWYKTYESIKSNDPEQRAEQRGYSLI